MIIPGHHKGGWVGHWVRVTVLDDDPKYENREYLKDWYGKLGQVISDEAIPLLVKFLDGTKEYIWRQNLEEVSVRPCAECPELVIDHDDYLCDDCRVKAE